MPDPTTTPDDPDNTNKVAPSEQQVEDSGPIDINELLESTRKLFEPEDLARSFEQAGYSPDAPDAPDAPEKSEIPRSSVSARVQSGGDTRGRDEAKSGAGQVTPFVGSSSANDTPAHAEPTESGVGQSTVEAANTVVGAAADSDIDGAHNDPVDTDHVSPDGDAPRPGARRGLNALSVVALLLALTLSPAAVVFGYISLGQARRASQRGEGVALWAIGVGWVVLASWVVLIASLLWVGQEQGVTMESLRELIELFRLP